MVFLPVEIKLSILHLLRDDLSRSRSSLSTPPPIPSRHANSFSTSYKLYHSDLDSNTSLENTTRSRKEYQRNLLSCALVSRDWTLVCQLELFRDPIIVEMERVGKLVDQLKDNVELRSFAAETRSITFGRMRSDNVEPAKATDQYSLTDESGQINELAMYCSNVREITCCGIDVRLSDLDGFAKLRTLHISDAALLGDALIRQSIFPNLARLSLYHVIASGNTIRKASVPHLKHLSIRSTTKSIVQDLIPTIDSLHLSGPINDDTSYYITAACSLSHLSLSDCGDYLSHYLPQIRSLPLTTLHITATSTKGRFSSVWRHLRAVKTCCKEVENSKVLKRVTIEFRGDGEHLLEEDKKEVAFAALRNSCRVMNVDLELRSNGRSILDAI